MIHSTPLLLTVRLNVTYDLEGGGPDEPLYPVIRSIRFPGGADNWLDFKNNEEGRPDEPLIHPDDLKNIEEAIVEHWKKPVEER